MHHLFDARVRSIDLVHDHHDGQTGLEGFSQDEPSLRERAFGGIDQEEYSVDHGQATLDLAAKIGVSRGIDDGDLYRTSLDGRVLGQDGDSLFTFEIPRIENSVGDDLIASKSPRLAEHGIDQRGFAVVDVRHDCDISEILTKHSPSRLATLWDRPNYPMPGTRRADTFRSESERPRRRHSPETPFAG